MRLPKHKMPKQIQKHGRTAKHKDSAAKKAKLEKKEMKANAMETDSTGATRQLTEEERESAKATRKKVNAHKMLYKKNNYSMTGRNGPRAVTE
jgi:hypothetical protein